MRTASLIPIGLLLLTAGGCGAARTSDTLPASTMTITSSAFPDSGTIPAMYTCDASNLSPPLTIHDVPANAGSLALIVHDPDAPGGSFVHWAVWNIDPRLTSIAPGAAPADATEGVNGAGRVGYTGPCPPSGTHHYVFTLYALTGSLPIPVTSTASEVRHAMDGLILAEARLTGLFGRADTSPPQ